MGGRARFFLELGCAYIEFYSIDNNAPHACQAVQVLLHLLPRHACRGSRRSRTCTLLHRRADRWHVVKHSDCWPHHSIALCTRTDHDHDSESEALMRARAAAAGVARAARPTIATKCMPPAGRGDGCKSWLNNFQGNHRPFLKVRPSMTIKRVCRDLRRAVEQGPSRWWGCAARLRG